MKHGKKRILSIIMSAILAGTLVGCGGTGNESPDNKGDAGAASNEVITYGMTSAWDSLNPYGSSSGSIYQQLVSDKIYDRLVYISEAGSTIEPRGAEKWESADEGKAALFHLNKNAKWHDGEGVTAKDWVFTLNLITNPKFDFGMKSEFNSIAGTKDDGVAEGENSLKVEAVDDYTLKINFKEAIPVEDWLKLHNKYLYVLPEHLLKDKDVAQIKTDELWKNPVGSGPCTFVSEVVGSELQFESFDDYHLGAPQFGKLVLKVVDPANTVTSISTGELDGFYQNPKVDDAMAAESLGLNVTQSETPTTVAVLLINNQNIKDKKVRQAMNYAVDKQLLIDQQLQGKGVPSATCIIPDSKYDAGIEWSRDVEKAKELLKEANWDSNKTLKMAITAARESMAAIIQQNLAEAGIKVDVQTVELATMFSGLQDGTYDLGICGSTAMDYPLWMAGYYDYRNVTYCQITDTRYAELQEKIASEINEDVRKELINEYQNLLYDEMPLVMLYHGYNFGVQSNRLQGYSAFDGDINNHCVWKWSVK